MLDALERIETDPVARTEFEKNLNLQKENITEVDENVATAHLVTQYESMKKDMNDASIQRVRMALNEVMSLNMASIYRKSQVAEHTAHNALLRHFGTPRHHLHPDCLCLPEPPPPVHQHADPQADGRYHGGLPTIITRSASTLGNMKSSPPSPTPSTLDWRNG